MVATRIVGQSLEKTIQEPWLESVTSAGDDRLLVIVCTALHVAAAIRLSMERTKGQEWK